MIVDVPVPAVIGDVATTVENVAETAAGATTTVAVCVTSCPFTCADTVLVPATVELSVPVATPLSSVGAAGAVRVFPVPVAASDTITPGTGLPCASRAVTVIVDVSAPAVIGEVAITVDSASDTPPGLTVTAAVCAIVTPAMVAPTVLDSATVELSVPVATPLAFVGPGCVKVFPVPDAANDTGTPGIGLLNSSRAVTVIVLVLDPFDATMGEVAAIVETDVDTGAGATVTLAV